MCIVIVLASIIILLNLFYLHHNNRKMIKLAENSAIVSQKMVKLHLIDNLEIHKLAVERVALMKMFSEAKGLDSMADAEQALEEIIHSTQASGEYYDSTLDTLATLRSDIREEIRNIEGL